MAEERAIDLLRRGKKFFVPCVKSIFSIIATRIENTQIIFTARMKIAKDIFTNKKQLILTNRSQLDEGGVFILIFMAGLQRKILKVTLKFNNQCVVDLYYSVFFIPIITPSVVYLIKFLPQAKRNTSYAERIIYEGC